jgi:hypothetical protein
MEFKEVRCPCSRKKLLGKFKQAEGEVACIGCKSLIRISMTQDISCMVILEDRTVPYQNRTATIKK